MQESVYPPSSSKYQGYASTSFPPSTSMTAMFAQNVAPYQIGEAWILDTGASHHMTSDVHNLNQVVPFEGFDKIKIGNGQGLPIKHIGSTVIHTHSHALQLSKVLHVPQLANDLLSFKQLCKDNT